MIRRLRRSLFLQSLECRTVPNSTPHVLATGDLTQDWTNTGLISANDDWSAVNSIDGYRGDGLAGSAGATDPQTVVADGTATPIDVNANLAAPNTFTTGGVAEFQLTNPVVALSGSGTSRAPHLLIHLDATGVVSVNISYLLRDLEDNTDNAVSKVALQYRVGNTGDFINLPAGFVADASAGPSVAGPDIPVNVTLPAAADNQPLVQVRIMTTDANGSDEWIGIDNIVVHGETGGGNNIAPSNQLPGPQTIEQNKSLVLGTGTSNAISVSDPDAGTGELKINLKVTSGNLTLGSLGGLTFSLGDGTADSEMTFTGTLANINAALDNSTFAPPTGFLGAATITLMSDDQGNTGAGGAKTDTDSVVVNVVPPLYHLLTNGPLTQNWTDTNLITTNNEWSNVPSIRGYRGDNLPSFGGDPQTLVADGSATPLNVLANQSNPNAISSGGIVEFDGIANPAVAFQASGSTNPHLVLFIDSTGATGVRLKFNAIDVDGSADDTTQKIAVQWRAGTTGTFTNLPAGFVADATDPGTGKTTAVDVTLPVEAANIPQLQIRILTVDAPNFDEFVAIDDIEVLQAVVNPNQAPVNKVPSTQFIDLDTSVTFAALTMNNILISDPDVGSGNMKVNIKASNGTLTLGNTTNLVFTIGDGTADAEMTFTGMLADINGAFENSTYTPTIGFKGIDTITLTTDDQGNTGGPAQVDVDSFFVSINPIIESTYHNLFSGPLAQDWSNIGLISADDDWSMVPSIIGFRGDNLVVGTGVDPQTVTAYGKPPTIDVDANATNPNSNTTGGIAEFDALANPAVALQGSNAAAAPHLTFYLNTANVTNVTFNYDLIDVDGSADNTSQAFVAQYRIGTSGEFINIPGSFVADATTGPDLAGQVTPVTFVLPVAAEGQAKVQVRILTTNAIGNDEWVAVDNINITATPGAGAPAKVTDVQVNDDSAQRSMVTSLKVAFNSIVTFVGAPQDAFSLIRQGTNAPVNLAASVDNSGTGTVVMLTFTGGSVDGVSLADGLYNLTVLANQFGGFGFDGNGDGIGGDNNVTIGSTTADPKLFRLFGDADGNATVNAGDFAAFRSVFGLSGPSIFDANGDNQTNAADFAQFRARFGLTLTP